jgi:hypothetical protein
MFAESVSSITSRSMPMPQPRSAAGRTRGRGRSRHRSTSPPRRRLPWLRLFEEARRLVFGVVQLGEAIGDLAAGDEQLEALGDLRVAVAAARQRADLGRVVDDEGRIPEIGFGSLLEELQLQRAEPGFCSDVDLHRRSALRAARRRRRAARC